MKIDLNEKWTIKTAKELYTYTSGISKGSQFFGTGYPYLTFTEIFHNYFVPEVLTSLVQSNERERENCSIKRGDVFLTRTSETDDELGMSCVALKDYPNATFNGFTKRLRPLTDEVVPEYAGFYFRSPIFRAAVTSMSSIITRASLNEKMLDKLPICYPSKPTQQKIASILSAYDNLIQNYKKQIQALQTAASELYKEWFVRFRFPGYKNSRFENGIPEGWKIERLGNLFEITSSKRVFEEDYVNEGIPFYRSKEIIELSNNQEITTELFISNELYAKFKNKFGVPKENDILITSVGSIGNSYQVRKDDIFYFKDGNLTWIKSSSKKALSKYLIYWLKSDLGKNTLISSTIGTSQSALTIEKLRAIKILVPEVNILEKFEQKISSFDIKIQILNKQITNLTQQRDLLLPRLMSGKLEVE